MCAKRLEGTRRQGAVIKARLLNAYSVGKTVDCKWCLGWIGREVKAVCWD